MWFNSILVMLSMLCNLEIADQSYISQEPFFIDSTDSKIHVSESDTLETDRDTYVRVEFKDGSLLTVAPQTKLIFSHSERFTQDADAQIMLLSGLVFLEMNKTGNLDIEVITDHTIVSIDEGKAGVLASGYIWSEDGTARVMAMPSGEITHVRSGTYTQISSDGSQILTGRVANQELVHLHEKMKPFSKNIRELSFVTSLEEKQE